MYFWNTHIVMRFKFGMTDLEWRAGYVVGSQPYTVHRSNLITFFPVAALLHTISLATYYT